MGRKASENHRFTVRQPHFGCFFDLILIKQRIQSIVYISTIGRNWRGARDMKINGNPFIMGKMPPIKRKEFILHVGLNNHSNSSHKDNRLVESINWVEGQKFLDELQTDLIAKRIARGERITAEEKEKIRSVDADKLVKAEEVNNRRIELKRRLTFARTKEEAKAILSSEKLIAKDFYDKGDQKYGKLLLDAIGKVEEDYYIGKLGPSLPLSHTHMKASKSFDAKY